MRVIFKISESKVVGGVFRFFPLAISPEKRYIPNDTLSGVKWIFVSIISSAKTLAWPLAAYGGGRPHIPPLLKLFQSLYGLRAVAVYPCGAIMASNK